MNDEPPKPTKESIGDILLPIAIRQLRASTDHKKARMEAIREYEQAYIGKVQPKFRQQFNVPMPVFSGLVDTLMADFDDPIQLTFTEQDIADYKKVKKINAAWKVETSSTRAAAKWNLKLRWDRFMAIISGRGIQKFYASSDPDYKSNFEVVSYKHFHCEPKGGGHLENHLFCGQEGVQKTQEELEAFDIYDKEQVKTLITNCSPDYKPSISATDQQDFARFEALNLSTSDNYVGQVVFNLCEWCLTYKGERYYLLFDPWTKTWIRAEKLKDIYSAGLYPWTSWATHEDPEVFWSKAYSDDFFPIAETITTLLNQELTNRQKQNLNAKAYDPAIFTDAAALDESQYRPDALVSVTVPAGKSITDGIFEFKTPTMQGTTQIIDWLEAGVSRNTGVDQINSQQMNRAGRTATVAYATLQQSAKRIGHKARAYVECYAEIGLRFVQGLKDHMKQPLAIKLLGENGYEWDEITRMDLNTKRDMDVEVKSTTELDKDNTLGKDAKLKFLEGLNANPVLFQQFNPKWIGEIMARDIGGYDDATIAVAMDVQNYGDKEILAEASMAIQDLLQGKKPQQNFNANTMYMKKILDFATDHRDTLGKKFDLFLEFVNEHAQIAAENMSRLAMKMNTGQMAPQEAGSPQGPQGQAPQPEAPGTFGGQSALSGVPRPPMPAIAGVIGAGAGGQA